MSLSGEQQFTTEVAASVPQCFAAITDFERYPEVFSGIQHAAVLERHANGLGKRVEFGIDMMLKRIRYVLEYDYEKQSALRWHSVDGDIEAIEGRYDFEKLGGGLTRVTCRQAVAVGFWVPGPIRKLLEQSALRQSVLELKAAAEASAQAATQKRKKKPA